MLSIRQASADDWPKNVTNVVRNVNILECGYYFWNPNEKCIQKSPNMPGIGSVNREIAVKMSERLRSKHKFAQ